MDLNKDEILIQNSISQIPNNDILLINNMKEKKSPQNKIRLLINKYNNHKQNKLNNDRNKSITSNKNLKNEINEDLAINQSLFLNKKDFLNEITLNSLAKENTLLKKEIAIVKSNLMISDEKEQLHRNTIQKIKKINKEKEISYNNIIYLINEYKKREIELKSKIKEMEIESNKKEEELNNALSIFKKEILNNKKIINDLNNKINNLNEQIKSLKKIINEKNEIISFFSKEICKNFQKNNFHMRHGCLTSSKSCTNIIARNIDYKISKTEKNINNIKDIKNYNSFRNFGKNILNDIVTSSDNNLSNNENKSEDDIKKIIKRNSYFKKINSNNTHINKKSLKIQSLKKNFSNKLLNVNNNSLNYSLNKIPKMIYDVKNGHNNKNKKNKGVLNHKKSFNKNLIKTDRNINENTVEELYINKKKIKFSPHSKIYEKSLKRNNIIEFKNYSFFLNDIEKSQPNKLIFINDKIKNKKINRSNIIYSKIINKKINPENIKGICFKKNKLIGINNFYTNFTNKNPSFVSN